MHITVSDETVAMLQEVAILLGEASVNAVGNAILQRECTRILNIARQQGVVSHEAHAQRQQLQQRQAQQVSQRRPPMQVPQPNQSVDAAANLSAALRKQASTEFQTFGSELGPDVSRTHQLQQAPPPHPETTVQGNFQYPGSTSPIRRVSK